MHGFCALLLPWGGGQKAPMGGRSKSCKAAAASLGWTPKIKRTFDRLVVPTVIKQRRTRRCLTGALIASIFCHLGGCSASDTEGAEQVALGRAHDHCGDGNTCTVPGMYTGEKIERHGRR